MRSIENRKKCLFCSYDKIYILNKKITRHGNKVTRNVKREKEEKKRTHHKFIIKRLAMSPYHSFEYKIFMNYKRTIYDRRLSSKKGSKRSYYLIEHL